ncbi:amidinotransferase [Pseudonocardiaceae bacterium YIM PH 21723]|nr:amidinotransferase [Pseudonocardiaceae bacterium YIM PH 21723]
MSSAEVATPARVPATRRYLMCPPQHFAVEYVINPWMNTDVPVDHALAMSQWTTLKETYEKLGHKVDLIDPQPGLPDMVFAANSATVIDGHVLGARFRADQRVPEAEHYRRWFLEHGYREVTMPTCINEAEGDFTWTGTVLLAGTGFRTDPGAHAEAQEILGVPVVSLQLIDPRYYHLDTALFVLDDRGPAPLICYYPEAFSPGSQRVLARLFPDAVIASSAEAEAFGLNGIADGANAVLPVGAETLGEKIADRGFEIHYVDISEFMKSGGGPKCCTMEIRD